MKTTAAIILALVLAACSNDAPTKASLSKPAAVATQAQAAIAAQFNSADEPTAIEASWTSPGVFTVSVKNNQTDRSGYAEYICTQMYDHGLKGKAIYIKIIDHQKAMQGEIIKLGDNYCP